MSSKLSRVLCASALAALVAVSGAAPALAEDPVTSGNVKFTKNIPYPLKDGATAAEGTDLEFATITVPGTAPSAPSPSAPAPPVKPIASKSKANKKKLAACIKKAKKAKKNRGKSKKAKRNLAKAIKRCKKKFKSRAATRALADTDGRRAGVQRTYAFAGSYLNGLQIVDVSDPANPIKVTTYDCAITQGDPQVFQRPDMDGRWFATFTADGTSQESSCVTEGDALGFDTSSKGNSGTYIIEVTNPAAPKLASFVYFEKGSHNQTVHPSGKFLYNSNSDLATDPMPGTSLVPPTSASVVADAVMSENSRLLADALARMRCASSRLSSSMPSPRVAEAPMTVTPSRPSASRMRRTSPSARVRCSNGMRSIWLSTTMVTSRNDAIGRM